MSKIVVITPVGPGHCSYAHGIHAPVGVEHIVIDDQRGDLGRSAARNAGMDAAPNDTEWFMFLDADDEFAPDFMSTASSAVQQHPHADVLLGTVMGVSQNGCATFRHEGLSQDADWAKLTEVPANNRYRICISGLFKASKARRHRFLEDMDKGEDIEFVLSMCASGVYRANIGGLTWIRCDRPSADGPRGYRQLNWGAEIAPIMNYWASRGQVPISPGERIFGYWKVK